MLSTQFQTYESSPPNQVDLEAIADAKGLWDDLLKATYFPHDSFFQYSARGSPFSIGIQTVKPAFSLGAKFEVKNGKSIRFWFDS